MFYSISVTFVEQQHLQLGMTRVTYHEYCVFHFLIVGCNERSVVILF